MKVRILGSGTSTGVPVIGCHCPICQPPDGVVRPRNVRTRAAISIRLPGTDHDIIIDTGPDFRQQVLAAGIERVEYVFYTHLHADHCHGFDDLRAFFFHRKQPIICYLSPEYLIELKERFAYAFRDTGYKGVTPQLELRPLPNSAFALDGIEVESRSFIHGPVLSYGFRFGEFLYVTDFKEFTPEDIAHWRGKIKVMVASGIHFRSHGAHSVIPETIKLFDALGVERGIITHLSHEVDYDRDSAKLPSHVSLAYDGMEIHVNA